MITERLEKLRSIMKEKNIDIYYVPTDDFHNSEYVGEYFKCRQFITGFTGSAGVAVITMNEAGLWTDGRYFLQAAAQLANSGITLYKMGEEGVPSVVEYLCNYMTADMCLGFDGRCVSIHFMQSLEKQWNIKKTEPFPKIVYEEDLIGQIWKERPAMRCSKAFSLDVAYAGKTREEKCSEIRKELRQLKADEYIISSLDDIAWLLNIRGNDVDCNPVILSYLWMNQEKITLYVNKNSFSEELTKELGAAGVTLKEYDSVYEDIKQIEDGKRLLLDMKKSNYMMLANVPDRVKVLDHANLTQLKKAVKNETEMENIRKAHLKDGIAVTKFMYWLKHNVGKELMTELSLQDKLEEFRKQQEHYMGPSFDPIMGYAEHGAIVHYKATKESDASVEKKSFLLSDTGGQYLEGTTDVTRTYALGKMSTEEKSHFTAVLRGNLRLGMAKFPYGTTGHQLDALARAALWQKECDYNHGTGHGVGYFLNVHEGPNNIRCAMTGEEVPLEEGMLTSNEPGLYLTGKYGIRCENLCLCKKASKNEFGQFMEFETVTLVPFDVDAIIPEEMDESERKALNAYHRRVYLELSPYLERLEREWLITATRPI